MRTLDEVHATLLPLADPSRADQMAAYMRNQFQFLGISAGERRSSTRSIVHFRPTDFDFAQLLFDEPEREYHYCACDHIRFGRLTTTDLPDLKRLVQTKSWWDTVDSLAKGVGQAADAESMLEWAQDSDYWVRRVAIIHQLGFRTETDSELLAQIIMANLGSKEFFINKAIGWALRDYSKANPAWVAEFIATHDLAPLSAREGSKYI
ncbi:DNA alkylation repair protein [Corynebacterium breve]|uniref:DNA alkylation repair protein n=1 Tax=Corynebacterium breve TaxID=3049799 RepID=A0ABY8VFR9_9CORY|nr:DNA alkylation repair protein [Corynebacterium breve]WIM68484.1 DNA alkylation repair protein [Corynebacterium breve]